MRSENTSGHQAVGDVIGPALVALRTAARQQTIRRLCSKTAGQIKATGTRDSRGEAVPNRGERGRGRIAP